MVTHKDRGNYGGPKIIAGLNRGQSFFRTVLAANTGVSVVILLLIWHFFNINFYSLLYSVLVAISVISTFAIIIGFDRYSFLRVLYMLPSFFVTPNIIIIIGSGSYYFGKEFTLCVTFSLIYIIFMTIYEILSIKEHPAFMKTAKKGLRKIGQDYFCKPEMGMSLVKLSSIKRSSAWIRTGFFGFLQKMAIGLIILLFIASFFFNEFEDGHLVTGFLLSIAGILLGILGRPTWIVFAIEQIAVYYLQKELNSKT